MINIIKSFTLFELFKGLILTFKYIFKKKVYVQSIVKSLQSGSSEKLVGSFEFNPVTGPTHGLLPSL